ncbi:MAG: 2-oxoglutarate dehydrogenase E1 component [Bacteroidetes bacterium]|nr:2-oxoglutarate dehydrogenase E1 component [Bacteroidota bacterium]
MKFKEMDKFSYLNTMDNSVFEELFSKYKQDPESIDVSWREFFDGFEFAQQNYKKPKAGATVYPDEFKVMNLINGYRSRGHLFTLTNPVRTRRQYSPTLDIENFGLSKEDLSRSFEAGNELGLGKATLQKILDHLNQTYCQSVGVEYLYIRNPEIIGWLKSQMEVSRNMPVFRPDQKENILRKLAEAVLFEKFIHKKFPGHKTFSLEGVESLIPALDAVIETGAGLGVKEFVIGMAHRGRLNTLANIMQKPVSSIFSEFDGKEYQDTELLGDVKYHLGHSSTIRVKNGEPVSLVLAPNPSHLEAVDPVVEGISRARIDHEYKGNNEQTIPVLIHGDASISGQGIVYEVLQMSELNGYKTGGTIHIVTNNQLGFTTNYLDGRSSTYCTDVGKTILSPVFHVNADDVEAVVYTVQLATRYRQQFHKDVFIDLLGYRKYGHNESDEPRFTQPILYKAIETHPDPLEIYVKKLEEEETLRTIDFPSMKQAINEKLEQGLEGSKAIEKADISPFLGNLWKGIRRATPGDFASSPDTGVDELTLREIGQRITSLPDGIPFFRKIIKLQEDRREMIEKKGVLDWAMGELLAYGTLLKEGFPVRLSGQDSQRGTFSHRHSVLTIEDSEQKFIPLSTVSEGQAKFEVINSLLSEYGVLGFEYGFALTSPETLTLWEAQFGDFSNGAQIIIDQYISSAEEKWKVMNGLVLLLPHGYEGQGPEHSSARLERFLAISGHSNIQVVNCTTPANFFHVLRRQMHRPFRKPLVIFTPKSLLRHPRCISPLEDFTKGGFREVIDDAAADPRKIKKVVFCCGKIYYDLVDAKEKLHQEDVALVRIEQLYPLPLIQLRAIVKRYDKAGLWHWIQEEPANMGACDYMLRNFGEVPLKFTTRPPSGSPATGSSRLHKIQQQLLVEKAMGKCSCEVANESCRLHCSEKEEEAPEGQ